MSTIQLSFTIRTSSNCKTVDLVGNWDGYKRQLPLSKDSSSFKSGAWKGTFKFKETTLNPESRYWYYVSDVFSQCMYLRRTIAHQRFSISWMATTCPMILPNPPQRNPPPDASSISSTYQARDHRARHLALAAAPATARSHPQARTPLIPQKAPSQARTQVHAAVETPPTTHPPTATAATAQLPSTPSARRLKVVRSPRPASSIPAPSTPPLPNTSTPATMPVKSHISVANWLPRVFRVRPYLPAQSLKRTLRIAGSIPSLNLGVMMTVCRVWVVRGRVTVRVRSRH